MTNAREDGRLQRASPARRLDGGRAGFTLLEMLMASIMISAILGVSYALYIGSMRSARRGTAEMACYQTGRVAMQAIAEDLRSALLTRGFFGFGLRGSDGEASGEVNDRLELSCTSPVRWRADPEGFAADPLPPRADFRRITYRVITPEEALEEDTEEGFLPTVGLVREVRTTPNLTTEDADNLEVQVLSRQVVLLDLQYFDGADWVDDWDAANQERMPAAVRITLDVLPGDVDLLEEAESGETDLLSDPEAPYPGSRRFVTVVQLPTAVESEGTRIMPMQPGTGFSP